MRGADEGALRGVRPRVVLARDGAELLAFGLIDDTRPPVPAHVVERPRATVLPADHEDAFAPDAPGDEVPRLRDVLLPTDAQPLAEEELLEFLLEDCGIPV